ncbi:MAG: hypothetical protein AAF721_13950 [Myxococcota bacterium]
MIAALVDAFIEALPEQAASDWETEALSRQLAVAAEQARMRYPAAFGDGLHFARRLAQIAGDEPARLAALPYADICLAEACARGDATERRQLALTKILAGTANGPAKIDGYRGRGRLVGWVRTVAARLTVDMLRARDAEAEVAVDPHVLADVRASPRQSAAPAHAHDVQAAIAEALGHLAPDERRLLRQRYVERRANEGIAGERGVHRTTIARQVEQIRTKLGALARAALRSRLRVDEATANSMMTMVSDGALEVSVHRLLASHADGEP